MTSLSGRANRAEARRTQSVIRAAKPNLIQVTASSNAIRGHVATDTVVKDPVCGMTVNPVTAKASAEHGGTTYFFCCPHCAEKFKADPERYLKPTAAPEPMRPVSSGLVTLGNAPPKPTVGLSGPPAEASAKDPVCGMTVDPARAKGSVEHNGTMYYFCSTHCVEKFTADPERYLKTGVAP